MNEDECGITPPGVTMMTLERRGNGWTLTIERGNGDSINVLELSDMERAQMGCMLESGLEAVSFVDLGSLFPSPRSSPHAS